MTDTTDDILRRVLTTTRVVAVVGIAADPSKPSHYVAQFLQSRGYRVVPVNPALAGQTLLGEHVYSGFSEIPSDIHVDMVDVFRRSEQVGPVVDEALDDLPHLRTIWMQVGIQNAEAAAKAEARGMTVIQNRCPKIDFPRLLGDTRITDFAAS